MVLIYLYIKGLPARAKIIFGVMVGSAFFVLMVYATFLGFFTDTMSRFVPANSDYYIHISKTDSNKLLDDEIKNIFKGRGLGFLKMQDMKREVAVFGRTGECSGLIIRVWNVEKIRHELEQNKINYFNSGDKIIVSDCQEIGSQVSYAKISSKVQKVYWSNYLGIYLSNKAVSEDIIFQAICAKQSKFGNCEMKGRLEADKLKIFVGQEAKTLPVAIPLKINGQEFDFSAGGKSLVKFISNFYQLATSSEAVNNLAYLPSALGTSKINNSLLLLNEKGSTSQPFWKKFDLYWKLELSSPLSESDISKLEDALRSEAAQEFPSNVNTKLTDGTNVTELVAQANKFPFVDGDGYKYFNYPDNSAVIYYKISSSSLIIANQKNLLDFQLSQEGNGDFIAVNSRILPETKLFSYIKFFKYIWADNNSIYLK